MYDWEEEESSHCDGDYDDCHASLTHDEIADGGKPTRPLEFPTPIVYQGRLTSITAFDHRTGVEYHLKNVLARTGDATTAYLLKKKIAKTAYGFIKLGVVLKRTPDETNGSLFQAKWQSTEEFVAIKISSWARIQAMRGRHLEDPIKEISVLQLIGNGSAAEHHVLGCNEVLQDAEHLYTVMPYCSGGELYSKFDTSSAQMYPDEEEARRYFGQLTKSLFFLQRKGICHRNLCLDNMLLDADDNLVLIDSGLSLRIPYNDPCNMDGVTDVSEGSIRRLMRSQGQCGALMYLAPEMLDQRPFDGHATDLWAAAVTLFVMLVGVAPFSLAQRADPRFKVITSGGLKDYLQGLGVSLSPEALDLLQGMLRANPRERFTLADVMDHPWVLGERFPMENAPAMAPMATVFESDLSEGKDEDAASQATTVDETSDCSTVEHEDNQQIIATAPPKGHRRKLSEGARDLVGKFKLLLQKKRAPENLRASV
ncbi:activated protein kinase catalytic subunit alpha-1 [Seminavis robusta]|uniref:Activated protein kinase catalytic subunit alpha-1 n=1 Tax=Seminavis robusta TaxID=568900 RepID=A0A9N8HT66_9STRA|nr:activated protein kinase catalytic subunit alpha-1 [Seminavis robusta]|eukprot:Sro1618_g286440.1 activated protein kinase catalytic subunit alpha-1 (482) ;mRNA; r:15954-17486